uniref:Uncharacterized protein n=1 Tax=Panagrolaimus davidi TaxID=227884 RepID=A0A914PNC5_9BILA
MDEWNGVYGRDLFISFNEEKPKYFEDAIKVFETKPSFVVYDIIKILSTSPDYVDPDSDWKFTLTKDVNNPVLLEFDNFDGTKKAASPQLLLALLIKQHVKAITAKIGSKPKRIAYCMMGTEKDVADDKIHLGIKEAFSMLKIDTFLLKFSCDY